MIKYTKLSATLLNKKKVVFNNIDKVFSLAVVGHACGTLKDYYGINIGISIKHKDSRDGAKFYDTLFGKSIFHTEGFVKIYLHGKDENKNNITIPVIVAEGNHYDEKYGTSCMFGYFSPDILATDERPKTKSFGAFPLELTHKLEKFLIKD